MTALTCDRCFSSNCGRSLWYVALLGLAMSYLDTAFSLRKHATSTLHVTTKRVCGCDAIIHSVMKDSVFELPVLHRVMCLFLGTCHASCRCAIVAKSGDPMEINVPSWQRCLLISNLGPFVGIGSIQRLLFEPQRI